MSSPKNVHGFQLFACCNLWYLTLFVYNCSLHREVNSLHVCLHDRFIVMFVAGESHSVPQKRLRNAKEFDKHLQRSGKGGGWCKFRCHKDTDLPVTYWHLPVPKGLQLVYSAISATSISTCSDDFQHESCQCGFSIKTWNATCNSIPTLRCQTWNFHAMLQAHGISRYCQRSRRFAVLWFFPYLSTFFVGWHHTSHLRGIQHTVIQEFSSYTVFRIFFPQFPDPGILIHLQSRSWSWRSVVSGVYFCYSGSLKC